MRAQVAPGDRRWCRPAARPARPWNRVPLWWIQDLGPESEATRDGVKSKSAYHWVCYFDQ